MLILISPRLAVPFDVFRRYIIHCFKNTMSYLTPRYGTLPADRLYFVTFFREKRPDRSWKYCARVVLCDINFLDCNKMILMSGRDRLTPYTSRFSGEQHRKINCYESDGKVLSFPEIRSP